MITHIDSGQVVRVAESSETCSPPMLFHRCCFRGTSHVGIGSRQPLDLQAHIDNLQRRFPASGMARDHNR